MKFALDAPEGPYVVLRLTTIRAFLYIISKETLH